MLLGRLITIAAALLALSIPAFAAPFIYVGVTSQFPSAGTNAIRVLDSQTLDTIATIPLPAGHSAKSIVLGLSDRRAYVASGDDSAGTGALVVIDTTTNTVVTTVTLAGPARGVTLSTDHQRVFVSHAPSFVSVFSTTDHTLLGQVSAGTPGSLARSPDGTTIYVGHSNGVTAFASSTLAVTRTRLRPRPARSPWHPTAARST
jgi:DNA-binding beta-propeller fold protein YncE